MSDPQPKTFRDALVDALPGQEVEDMTCHQEADTIIANLPDEWNPDKLRAALIEARKWALGGTENGIDAALTQTSPRSARSGGPIESVTPPEGESGCVLSVPESHAEPLREELRADVGRALDRDGQHDWDETGRLADLVADYLWRNGWRANVLMPVPVSVPVQGADSVASERGNA